MSFPDVEGLQEPPADRRSVTVLQGVAGIAFLVFLVGTLVLGASGTPLDPTSFLLVLLYFVTLVLLTLAGNLFLDAVVLFSLSFFGQRIFFLLASPESFDFFPHQVLTTASFQAATLFITLVNLVLGSVYMLFVRLRGGDPRRFRLGSTRGTAEARILPWPRMPVELIFWVYAAIAAPLVILQLVLRVDYQVGVAGVPFDTTQFAVLVRLGGLATTLAFLPWIVLLSARSRRPAKLAAGALVALFVLSAAAQSSRAFAFSFLVVPYVLVGIFAGKGLTRRQALLGVLGVGLTLLLWAPLTAFRSGVINGAGLDAALGLSLSRSPDGFFALLGDFSSRFAGFDLLAAFEGAGRELFTPYAGWWPDLVDTANAFIPGRPLPHATFIPAAKLIPLILRNYPSLEAVGGFGEDATLFGMAYLYFGIAGGLAFVGTWAYVSLRVLHSQAAVALKIIYFNTCVLTLCLGGSLSTSAITLIEALGLFLGVYIAARVLGLFRARSRHAPSATSLPHRSEAAKSDPRPDEAVEAGGPG